MILDIVTYPAASLKEKCVPVTEITDEIRQLAADMLETMYEAPGVGLAAPQVGRNIRMLVMDPAAQDEEKQPRVVINPELTLSEDTVLSRQEGCLSVPLNYRADVQRAERVHLRYMDLDGKIVEEDLEGFPAIVIQHEADHLDGTLFIDRIGRLRRSLYDTRVKTWLNRKGESSWVLRTWPPPCCGGWSGGPAATWWPSTPSLTGRPAGATS